jgi:hypothetical protein
LPWFAYLIKAEVWDFSILAINPFFQATGSIGSVSVREAAFSVSGLIF